MTEILEYANWRDEYRDILKSFGNKLILFSFSGGKDSSLALDFLLKAKKEFHFNFETHAGAFPVHRYTNEEKERIGDYWKKRGIDIFWHDFIETDELIRETVNPCHSCQSIRKELLKNFVINNISDLENLVLIVCFSLWDIVGYSLEHILGEIFSYSNTNEKDGPSKRFIETSQRYYPYLKMNEGYSMFRPLIKYNGCDILYTVKENNIPILSIPCEFKDYRPKRILDAYYTKMGLRFDYERVFEFAKKNLGIPDASSYTTIKKEIYLKEIF